MALRDRSFSIQPMHALGGMLCLTLMACQGAVYGMGPEKPDKADVQNNGARVQLRDDPALRKPISGEFRDPKPQDIVDLVRKETGQRLSLDASVIQDRPLQGHTRLSKVPAWAALENLARNQYIKGYWTKRGDEYVLIATYSAKPPPLPPELPPHLRAAMDKAEKGLPPDPPPKKYLYLSIAVGIGAVIAISLFLLSRWQRAR
jgi:hypothetical protein